MKIPSFRGDKRFFLGLLVLATFLFTACASGAATASRSDAAAPDFEIPLFGTDDFEKGETLKLSDLEGKPVVVNFWFPSCAPCVAEMPDIEASYQKHKDDVGFVGIQLIGLDTADDGQEFVNRLGINYAIGPDETGDIIIRDYKVPGFPTTLFLNSDHTIERKWTGPLNEAKLEELVSEILN